MTRIVRKLRLVAWLTPGSICLLALVAPAYAASGPADAPTITATQSGTSFSNGGWMGSDAPFTITATDPSDPNQVTGFSCELSGTGVSLTGSSAPLSGFSHLSASGTSIGISLTPTNNTGGAYVSCDASNSVSTGPVAVFSIAFDAVAPSWMPNLTFPIAHGNTSATGLGTWVSAPPQATGGPELETYDTSADGSLPPEALFEEDSGTSGLVSASCVVNDAAGATVIGSPGVWGQSKGTWNLFAPLPNLTVGMNTVDCTAVTGAGVTGTIAGTVGWDPGKPSITYEGVPSSGVADAPVAITAIGAEQPNISGVAQLACTVDGGVAETVNGPDALVTGANDATLTNRLMVSGAGNHVVHCTAMTNAETSTSQTETVAIESTTAVKSSMTTALAPRTSDTSLASIVSTGAYNASFAPPTPGVLTVRWYLSDAKAASAKSEPVLVAEGTKTFGTASRGHIKIKLTPAGKQMLRHAKHVTLTADAIFEAKRATKPIAASSRFTLNAGRK